MQTGRKTRALLTLTLLAWAQIGLAQTVSRETADAMAPLPRQSRLVLLPLPEPIHDARVLEALAQMRIGKRNRVAPKPPRRNNRFDKLQKGEPKKKDAPEKKGKANKKDKTKTKPPPSPPLPNAFQLQTIARVLFREALAERLQTALKIAIVSDAETQAALQNLPTGAALTPETAGQLALKCRADAVLTVADEMLALPSGEAKRTVLRVRLRVFGPRPSPEIQAASALPERDFFTASAAERPVTPFGKRPSRIGGQGTGRAARQAALRAAHTLRTGEILPLCLPDIKFALAPVPAPASVDELLFASEGRSVQTAAVRGLSSEVSGLFAPDLAPLPETRIIRAYKMRNTLARQGLPITALWTREDDPQIERARKAARELGAAYVLMATVSELDVDAGLETGTETSAKTAVWLAEGRAEAVGVLLRVSDGAILWRDRSAVSLPSRADRSHSFSTLRQEQSVARDAAKFALLDLQRRFHKYVAHFES